MPKLKRKLCAPDTDDHAEDRKLFKRAVTEVMARKFERELEAAETFNLTEDEERKLSDIIRDVNSKTGKSFDNDVAVKAALQIRDLMKKNEGLKASARNNTVADFTFAYFDNIDDALLDGRSQNQEFFDLLLKNQKIRDEILGIFVEEIYNSLKKAE